MIDRPALGNSHLAGQFLLGLDRTLQLCLGTCNNAAQFGADFIRDRVERGLGGNVLRVPRPEPGCQRIGG